MSELKVYMWEGVCVYIYMCLRVLLTGPVCRLETWYCLCCGVKVIYNFSYCLVLLFTFSFKAATVDISLLLIWTWMKLLCIM